MTKILVGLLFYKPKLRVLIMFLLYVDFIICLCDVCICKFMVYDNAFVRGLNVHMNEVGAG